jgi:hypothetical protein
MENKNKKWTWAPVTHACNPSYPGGRNKDYGLKLTRENSSGIPYIEKPFTKIGLAEWLKVKALSSNPSTHTHTHKSGNRSSNSCSHNMVTHLRFKINYFLCP